MGVARSAVALLFPLLLPSRARAEPSVAEPIVFIYESPAECPSEAVFLAMVRAYTTHWTAVPEGTVTTRTIRVRIAAGPTTTVGKLSVASTAGTTSEREMAGPNCAEVSQALAIMVAVAINPNQGDDDQRAPDAIAGVTSPSVHAPAEPAPKPPAPRDAAPVPAERSRERLRIAIDLRAELTSAVVDGVLPVVAASVDFEPSFARPAGFPRWWRPSLGLGLRQSLPREHALRDATVNFSWTAGGARLCPFRFAPLGTVLEIAPCAEMNIGVLRAQPEGLANARDASTLWLDLGGSVWAAVHLSRRVFVSGTVLVTAPASRRSFQLAGGAELSSAPAVGLLGGLGIGLTL